MDKQLLSELMRAPMIWLVGPMGTGKYLHGYHFAHMLHCSMHPWWKDAEQWQMERPKRKQVYVTSNFKALPRRVFRKGDVVINIFTDGDAWFYKRTKTRFNRIGESELTFTKPEWTIAYRAIMKYELERRKTFKRLLETQRKTLRISK